ncbi:MAG: MFS transporter [Acidimicrobiales bacterium]
MTRTPDATVDSATPVRQGTARDVLAIASFRRIFLAPVASSTGRWMQNVALGIFAYNLDGSKSFTTLVVGVQMFPLLALSLPSGSLADTVDRRKLLIVTQAWQAVFGVILAWQVWDGEIAPWVLLSIVFAIGVGQALYAPTFTAVIPTLVGRENLASAIALNSMMINGSRILGPILGSATLGIIKISGIFLVNSATYLIIIFVLAITPIPTVVRDHRLSVSDRLFGGLRVAFRSPQVGGSLLVMVTFSLLCLPFIGLLPAIAESWGVDSESATYGMIYAVFGAGALAGVTAVASGLGRFDRALAVRCTLALFARPGRHVVRDDGRPCVPRHVLRRSVLLHHADRAQHVPAGAPE